MTRQPRVAVDTFESLREPGRVVESRVLAELQALRYQVATLQQLVLQREFGWSSGASGSVRGLERASTAEQLPLFATFFGGFAVYRDQRRLSIGSNRSVCELGTYLIAHAGKSVARDELMELLWPEVDPARAAHRLHVAVSELRRIIDLPRLASLVRLGEDSYQIAAASVATDCELFEQHFQHARLLLARSDDDGAAAAFRAALQVYTGEFLADHPYVDWADQRRAHFAERHLSVLTALCDHSSGRNDFNAVEEYASAILRVDNLREQAHRHLMRAHYMRGQRAAAVRQYRACVADLHRELGVPPSLLTQRLAEAIAADTELPPEAPAAALPS